MTSSAGGTDTIRRHATSSAMLIFGMISIITGGVPIGKKLSGSAKSLTFNPSIGAPNFASGEHSFAVFSVCANQNTQIFGRTWLRMKRNRVSTDDQVPNLSGVESG